MATTEEYLDSLNRDKDTLVANLNTKGVTADNTETFTTLSKKVLNVPGVESYIDGNIVLPNSNVISCIKRFPVLDCSKFPINNGDYVQCFYNFFARTYDLEEIDRIIPPNVDNVKIGGYGLDSMFDSCKKLKKIPMFNTIKVDSIDNMFAYCESIEELPYFDFSSVKSASGFLKYCKNLKRIPEYDFSAIIYNMSNAFSTNLKLEIAGGFLNYGKSIRSDADENDLYFTLSLSEAPNLTYESLMNFINKIYDIKSRNLKPQKIWITAEQQAKLTPEEIAIATNKGWNVGIV